ncbi:hypothetical protein FJZ19_00235 [Candidatus Pacearchaeota archaeon]|nr:hypothetical protein [Candidatus Pacearchaeota archaeon]
MKFNFRKIASVLASVVMLGSTLGIAAAANYPAPFVVGGAADGAVVVTSGSQVGAVSDWDAAVSTQTALQALVSVGTSTTTTTTTGGDSVNLATSSQKLYMNSALNAARTILTKDHMPNILADGSAYDNSGTEYKYTQTITVIGGNRKVTFSKSGESMDPGLLVDTGYQGTTPLYNYTLTFSKTLNVSDSSVVGTATIKMLGSEFTIGANSDADTLYLYGSGAGASVNEGETKTVKVADKDHTVLLVGTSSTTSATIEVDGVRKTVSKGSSYKFAGDFQVYVKDLFHATKTGTLSSADLLLGAKTLHLENNQAVKYGADDTTILGTAALVSGTSGSGINSVTIAQAAESATGDYLTVGQSFTDRVLGGVQVEFAAATPDMNSTARDTILVDTDNSVAARVKFTSYLAGTAGEKQLAFARDRDLIANGALLAQLATDANYTIWNIEGANAKVGDWIIANDNDEGRIFQVISIGAGTSTNDYTRLRDVITGTDYDFATGTRNATLSARTIGGAEYNAATDPSNTDSSKWVVNLTWGAVSSTAVTGTQITVFPRIKLKNGEWLSFISPVTLTNGTVYSLPGLYDLTTYKAGQTVLIRNDTEAIGESSTKFGNVNYTLNVLSTNSTATIEGINTDNALWAECIVNATYGPAVLIQEEKTLSDTNGNYVCIPLTIYTSGSTNMPGVGTPVSADTVLSLQTMQTNTYKSKGVTTYGTLVERDVSTGTNYAVSVSYPDEQMYVDVLFKSPSAVTVAGSASAGGGTIKVVKDADVDSVKDKNLLVVGGSCVNTVARKIVDANATAPVCGAAWTAKTNVGVGQYLIKAVASPYNSAKVAVLVAGYEAADTKNAVAKLKENHATTLGTSNVYPVVTA